MNGEFLGRIVSLEPTWNEKGPLGEDFEVARMEITSYRPGSHRQPLSSGEAIRGRGLATRRSLRSKAWSTSTKTPSPTCCSASTPRSISGRASAMVRSRTITGWRRGFRRIGSGVGFPPRCGNQRKQSDILLTPWGIASVKVMRIPCSGRRITMGRASMVWPGTRRKSYFRSRTLRIMRICSMA